MLGTLIISIFVFILCFMIVIVKTEGFKLTIASLFGVFGLVWAYFLIIWSSFKEFVINPAISTILGGSPLNFYTISATMLFVAWCFVIFVAIINIFMTANKGRVSIFQNMTENKNDNI